MGSIDTVNNKTTTGKQSGLISSSSYMILASLFSTIVTVVTGLLLIRLLIPEHYGIVAYYLRIFAVVRFLGTLGLGAKIIEDIARSTATDTRPALATVIHTGAVLRFVSTIVVAVILAGVALVNDNPIFFWAGLAGMAGALVDYTNAIAQGLKLHRIVAGLSFTQPSLFFLCVIYLALLAQPQPEHIYITFTGSFILTLIIYAITLRASIPTPHKAFFSWDYLRSLFKPMFGLFTFGLLNILYLSLGTLILGHFELFEEAAYFNAPFSLVSMPASLGLMVVTSVYYPELISRMAQGRQGDAAGLSDMFIRAGSIALAVPTTAAIVYPDVIIPVLYTENYNPAIIPLLISAPLICLLFVQQFLTFGLYASQRVMLVTQIMALQVMIVLTCSIMVVIWLPEMSAHALALIYVIATGSGFYLQWRALKRLIPFKLSLLEMAKITLLAGISFIIARLATGSLLHFSGLTALIVGSLIGSALFLACMFTLLGVTERQRLIFAIKTFSSKQEAL